LLGQHALDQPLLDISSGARGEGGEGPAHARKPCNGCANKSGATNRSRILNVIHSEAPDIDDFLELLRGDVDRTQVRVGPIGAVIGSHAGPARGRRGIPRTLTLR